MYNAHHDVRNSPKHAMNSLYMKSSKQFLIFNLLLSACSQAHMTSLNAQEASIVLISPMKVTCLRVAWISHELFLYTLFRSERGDCPLKTHTFIGFNLSTINLKQSLAKNIHWKHNW